MNTTELNLVHLGSVRAGRLFLAPQYSLFGFVVEKARESERPLLLYVSLIDGTSGRPVFSLAAEPEMYVFVFDTPILVPSLKPADIGPLDISLQGQRGFLTAVGGDTLLCCDDTIDRRRAWFSVITGKQVSPKFPTDGTFALHAWSIFGSLEDRSLGLDPLVKRVRFKWPEKQV